MKGSCLGEIWRAFIFVGIVVAAPVLRAAEFVFVSLDGPGVGLNDTTPAVPVGGNPGTTLGAQRLAALQRTGEIWGRYLVSAVPIRVEVQYKSLGASTLAAAGPVSVESNFANVPLSNTLYGVAHANSLAGTDLRPTLNDITMTVSSDADFYLGFTQNSTDEGSNFIEVVLHELGHGLGFISFADPSDGSFLSNTPDVFSSLIYDIEKMKRWPELTASERVVSATSGANLTWDGKFSNAAALQVLAPDSGGERFVMNAVEADFTIIEDITYLPTNIGARIPGRGISGLLVVTDDGGGTGDSAAACADLINPQDVAGNIAFIRRGECNFDDKVFHAQEAGAIAVLIANNVDGGLISASGDGIVDDVAVEIDIPTVFISRVDGDALAAASPGVRLDFMRRTGTREGTASGRLNLYAPDPVESSSSVSHWADGFRPQLLMEPRIGPSLDRKLDLTLTQLKDIGWEVMDIPIPFESYATWSDRVFLGGETETAEEEDPDGDGSSNIEEFFFGTSPVDSSSARIPTFLIEEGEPQLEMLVSDLPADLEYALETSETLESFSSAVPNVNAIRLPDETAAAGITRMRFKFTAQPERFFARVRIQRLVP